MICRYSDRFDWIEGSLGSSVDRKGRVSVVFVWGRTTNQASLSEPVVTAQLKESEAPRRSLPIGQCFTQVSVSAL
jgi:hypothetical protein